MFKLKRTNPGLHQETRSPVYDRDGGPLGDEPLQSVASIPQVHPVTSEVKGGRRVLVVAPQPFYEDRGTPICVRQVVEALTQLGHRVDILTYPIGQNLGSAAVAVHRSSNPFRISNVPVGFSLRKLLLDSTLVIRLRQLLASGRYDAVHAVEEAAFPAALWGPKFGVPVIYDMHSSMAEQMGSLTPFRNGIGRRFFGGMERWLLDRASLVVSSAGLARRVREISPAARIREWRFSSEIAPVEPLQVAALRESLRIAPHQRVVLYSGTFERYQGLRTLLAAIPQVLAENPDAVFVLVGVDGEQAAVRIQRVAKAIPGERLRLVSRQPRHSIPTYFAMADVLVSPRLFGGNLPLKIFDYMAAGRPIVATDIPSHRSVLTDQRAVLVSTDPGALGHAISSLLRDPVRAGQLARAGQDYAQQHLSWSSFVRSVDELYRSLDSLPALKRRV